MLNTSKFPSHQSLGLLIDPEEWDDEIYPWGD